MLPLLPKVNWLTPNGVVPLGCAGSNAISDTVPVAVPLLADTFMVTLEVELPCVNPLEGLSVSVVVVGTVQAVPHAEIRFPIFTEPKPLAKS